MKWLIFSLIVISTVACSSLDKLVEQGRYEEVIHKSQKRLAGKKKKTKDVETVERAFAKAIQERMDRIKHHEARGGLGDWERIHAIAGDIGSLQRAIDPLLPLISEDGYEARFTFVDHERIARKAVSHIGRITHDEVDDLLVDAERGNKSAAREAHGLLINLERYQATGGDWQQKLDKAISLGTSYLAMDVKHDGQYLLPRVVVDELLSVDQTHRDQWLVMHPRPEAGRKYDYNMELVLDLVDVSPERVTERVHHFQKEILITDWARDSDGQFILDSLGEKIEVSIPQTVYGDVLELHQQKTAALELRMRLKDGRSGGLLQKEVFTASAEFDNVACRRSGDERAIERRWLDIGQPAPFPTDTELLLQAAEQANGLFMDYLRASDERLFNG